MVEFRNRVDKGTKCPYGVEKAGENLAAAFKEFSQKGLSEWF
jgi:hypothetical protein